MFLSSKVRSNINFSSTDFFFVLGLPQTDPFIEKAFRQLEHMLKGNS